MLFCEFFPKGAIMILQPVWSISWEVSEAWNFRLKERKMHYELISRSVFFLFVGEPLARLFTSNISTPWGRTQVPLAGRPRLCGTCFCLLGRGAQMLLLRQVCCLDLEKKTGPGISCGWFCWLPRWKINSWYKLLPSHLPRVIVQCLFKTTYMGTHY